VSVRTVWIPEEKAKSQKEKRKANMPGLLSVRELCRCPTLHADRPLHVISPSPCQGTVRERPFSVVERLWEDGVVVEWIDLTRLSRPSVVR